MLTAKVLVAEVAGHNTKSQVDGCPPRFWCGIIERTKVNIGSGFSTRGQRLYSVLRL